MPDARAQVARCAREKEQVQLELANARRQCEALAAAPQALDRAEQREAVARERAARMAVLASKSQACDQARTMVAEIDREIAALGPAPANGSHTPEEQAEREQIAASRHALVQQVQDRTQRSNATLARLDQLLAALPAACDEARLVAAAQAVASAREALATAEHDLLAAVRDAQAAEELAKQSAALAGRREQGQA